MIYLLDDFYIAVIDRNNRTMQMKYLRIVAVMSSIKYKWKIRLTQVLLKPLNKVGPSHTTTPSAVIPVPDGKLTYNVCIFSNSVSSRFFK
jgi:hypothetical protein